MQSDTENEMRDMLSWTVGSKQQQQPVTVDKKSLLNVSSVAEPTGKARVILGNKVVQIFHLLS